MSAEAPLRTLTLDHCLACNGRALEALPLRYEFRGTFPLARCANCAMRFLRVQPAPESLVELYSSDYFESDFRCGRSDANAADESAFHAENAGLLDAFGRWSHPGDLLEVGSATGWLLKHAIERGWRARGVELSADAVARSRALGLDVFHGDLLAAALPSDAFDLVYMGDVLEHVPDCRAALLEVVRVLRPGGHFYLRGPTTTHSLARALGLKLYALAHREIVLREPPYHLWEFTPGPLARLYNRCGLDVVESRQAKIPPGRAHGKKSAVERAAMAAIDLVNLPLTRIFNVRGDRIVMVGRKRRV